MAEPFLALRFLYVGSAKFDEDLKYYGEVLGAEKVWHFQAFGVRVAAFRLSENGPLYLLADHRPAGTCMPVYEVADLAKATKALLQDCKALAEVGLVELVKKNARRTVPRAALERAVITM